MMLQQQPQQPASNSIDQRMLVIQCARSWIGTPFHHRARVKGSGVDCIQLIVAAYEEAGVLRDVEVPPYPPDFMLHQEAERYITGVVLHASEIPLEGNYPAPGDVVLWKFGKCFSHGALVSSWPNVIHAYARRPVLEENLEQAKFLTHERDGSERPMKLFRYKGWC